MTSIELDMIQTAGIGALALMVGMVLTRKVDFLQKFCVPSPVSGGIIFSLITLILYGWFDVEVSFDGTLKDVCMLAFFTSVGFQSDLKVLKQGGKLLAIMLTLLAYTYKPTHAIGGWGFAWLQIGKSKSITSNTQTCRLTGCMKLKSKTENRKR